MRSIAVVERAKKADANNRLYQIESTMDYDRPPTLRKSRRGSSPSTFADDAVNPPELGVLEAGVAPAFPARASVVVPAGPRAKGTTPRCARRCGRATWPTF
jgi:homoserine O-acetyltransferase